jgi:hypothetical protein
MKTYILIALLIIGCVFLLGASETTRKTQWEYGCLSGIPETSLWVYNFSNEHYSAESSESLCSKIFKRTIGKDESAVGLIMDYAGAQGWELVSINDGKIGRSWWFKRPK